VRRCRAVIVLAITLVALALSLAACGGGDDGEATPSPAPQEVTPTETTTPPGGAASLPPEFVECMADQGFDVETADDIHSAPADVLQACFGALHQGVGTP
jgi:hypothetical protein